MVVSMSGTFEYRNQDTHPFMHEPVVLIIYAQVDIHDIVFSPISR